MNKLLVAFICLFAAVNASVINSHEWDAYKAKYLKKYKSLADERYHMDIFLQHKNEVVKHNRLFNEGVVSYTMSLNAYSDLSHTEFVSNMNGARYERQRTSRRNTSLEYPHLMELAQATALPSSIDWRTKGAVSDVEEQGSCGSCWAFSVVGSLEGQHFRKTGHLVELSAQNLVDCINSDARQKCRGQSRHEAMDYIKRNGGIDTEKSYPYRSAGGSCKYSSRNSGAKLQGYKDLPEGDEMRLQQAIVNVGPISVCVDASHDSFQHYSGGIYYEPKCGSRDDDLDHAVLVVGYGTDRHNKDYYIIKNSWGTDWGEKGFMKLARNRKNHCGIATDATYPIV